MVRFGLGRCVVNMRASSRHAGSSRSIVVGAVMDLARAWRETAFTAGTKVIVVSADDDGFILEQTI